ncbi:MAG: hypothetical protein NTZ67_02265 [Gammaproteobacteria bacterium]|nr:hypothetical protein [Gammaproteobacteria bacterium]
MRQQPANLPYSSQNASTGYTDVNSSLLTQDNLAQQQAAAGVVISTTDDALAEKIKRAERAYLLLQLKYYGMYLLLFGGSLALGATSVISTIYAVLNKTADPEYIGINRSGEDSQGGTHFNIKSECTSILSGFFNAAFANAMALSGQYGSLTKSALVFACGGTQNVTIGNSTFITPENGLCTDYADSSRNDDTPGTDNDALSALFKLLAEITNTPEATLVCENTQYYGWLVAAAVISALAGTALLTVGIMRCCRSDCYQELQTPNKQAFVASFDELDRNSDNRSIASLITIAAESTTYGTQ